MGTCHRPWKDATKIWNVLELMCRAKRGPAASAGGEMCHLDALDEWSFESDSGLSHHWQVSYSYMVVYGWFITKIRKSKWMMTGGTPMTSEASISEIGNQKKWGRPLPFGNNGRTRPSNAET